MKPHSTLQEAVQDSRTAGRSRIRILIVEDNPTDRHLIRDALESAGIQADLHIAEDGQEALDILSQFEREHNCPDVLLLDINLPKVTGDVVLQELRKSYWCRMTRVMIVSSSEDRTELNAIRQLGVDDIFRKPNSYTEYMALGTRVKSLLRT